MSSESLAHDDATPESGRRERLAWGPRVRDARRRLNLSQSELAVHAGVSLGTVQNIENGKTVPQRAKLAPILDTLGLSRRHAEQWNDAQWYVAETAVAIYDQVPISRQAEAAARMAAILADLGPRGECAADA